MDFLIGTVCLFAFSFVPEGFLPCNGQELPIMNYEALFSLIGTQYGGDGKTNFKLPDLSSTVPNKNMTYCICVNGIYPSRS